MSVLDEKNIDPIQVMTRIANELLNLPSWGFKESFRSNRPSKMIFDSEWCRVALIWEGWDYLVGPSMQIRYGRLHAPNERDTMLWNEEEYRCWHRVEYALHFLDRHTPARVAQLDYSHPVTSPFYEERVRQKFDRRQPEWAAELHMTIWKEYGQRLFDLFDLRRPDLWQEYQQFLKKVYDIAGRRPRPGPPMDKVY